MKYIHNVNQQWLEARKENQILTATDVVSLLPAGRTYRGFIRNKKEFTIEDVKAIKDTVIDLDDVKLNAFINMGAEKASDGPVDTISYNDAARGHWFEPFAVLQCNYDNNFFNYYHGDDCVIKNDELGIGFSPDALDIEQPKDCPISINASKEANEDETYSILEIKSYQPPHHFACVRSEDSKLDERGQVASAFVTDVNISYGLIYYFCPALKDCYSKLVAFDRDDLELEMLVVKDILSIYNAVKEMCRAFKTGGYKLVKSEWDIYSEYVEYRNSAQGKVDSLSV